MITKDMSQMTTGSVSQRKRTTKEGDTMKNCFYCNGRKVKYKRDAELKITVVCEKCGAEIVTPYLTEDSARGYWNMKQAALERAAGVRKEAAAS